MYDVPRAFDGKKWVDVPNDPDAQLHTRGIRIIGVGGTLALAVIAIAPFVFIVWLAFVINAPAIHSLAERWSSLPLW